MNKIILMGRLTRDPEIRQTQDGLTIARFGIAVDRRGQNKETDFFNCTAFGKLAEFCERYLRKGTKIATDGRLQNDTYTNRDGVKVTAAQIILNEIEFAESKKAEQPQTDEPVPVDDLADSGLPFN